MNKKLILMLSTLSLCVSITGCSAKNSSTTQVNNKTQETSKKTIGEIDTYIELGGKINIKGEGAKNEDNKITITKGGTYSISGKISDGQIIVDVGKENKVELVLDNADITSSNNAPIYVKSAKKAIVALADNSKNNISDGKTYTYEDKNTDEPNAAIFSKDDLVLTGSGTLIVNGNYNNGIVSKDDLKIEGGNITVNSAGVGIKATDNIVIEKGKITIDSSDDAIHSNNSLTVNGGTINITSGDDGIHSDTTLEINNGKINITKSYEGIESKAINIKNGDIHITASDDGINASSGNNGYSVNDRPEQNNFSATGDGEINIDGGYIYIDSMGDGVDSNGSVTMTDGLVLVNGPTNNGNGALDYDGTFEVEGGTLIAAGSAGMAQTPSTASSQNSVSITLSQQNANSIIHIQSQDGENIITFSPTKQYQTVVVTSPKLETGSTYNVFYGGESSGEAKDGLYTDGKYSGGTKVGSFKISSSVSKITENGVIINDMKEQGGKGFRGGRGKIPPQDNTQPPSNK